MKLLGYLPLFFLIFQACGQNKSAGKQFGEELMHNNLTFSSIGRNNYFILEPGYQLILKGKDGKDSVKLVITVLNETKIVGKVETRIVEENESLNGKTVEISRNFFAFCNENSSVYYFGEEVDIYKDGKITGHEGAWIAEGKNKPGIMIPGLILPGSRYYEEIAPGVAMDRAEIVNATETMETPAGKFTGVLKTEETTPLEPLVKEFKYFAPGIGLIKDENLVLVKYGYIK